MKEIMGGIALFGLSLLMVLGYLRADVDAGPAATVAALFIAVGLPALGGFALLRRHHRLKHGIESRTAMLRQQTLESEVLRFAALHEGRLTAVEVTAELGLPVEQAKQVLDGLMVRGLADIEVSDSGLLVYRFHDIEYIAEKKQTRSLLDD